MLKIYMQVPRTTGAGRWTCIQYHRAYISPEKAIRTQVIDFTAILRFSHHFSQLIQSQDGGTALYYLHQMAKAVARRHCVTLSLLQRLCI